MAQNQESANPLQPLGESVLKRMFFRVHGFFFKSARLRRAPASGTDQMAAGIEQLVMVLTPRI